MKNVYQPNEVRMSSVGNGNDTNTASSKNVEQPNSVSSSPLPLLLRKNRHMSGLMCPTMGAWNPQANELVKQDQ